MLGRNDCSEQHLLSREFMICFAVVTGISKDCSKFDSVCRLLNQPFEFAYIWVRASASFKGNDEVGGDIDNDSKLRVLNTTAMPQKISGALGAEPPMSRLPKDKILRFVIDTN